MFTARIFTPIRLGCDASAETENAQTYTDLNGTLRPSYDARLYHLQGERAAVYSPGARLVMGLWGSAPSDVWVATARETHHLP